MDFMKIIWPDLSVVQLTKLFFNEKKTDDDEDIWFDSSNHKRLFHKHEDLRAWSDEQADDAQPDEFTEACAIRQMMDYFYYDMMDYCGCGNTYGIENVVDRLFECFPYEYKGDLGATAGFDFDIFKEKFADDDPTRLELKRDFLMHWMDAVGFTEHGTTVRYPWLDYYLGFVAKEVFHRWVTKYRAIYEEKGES